jgi:dihydroxyacetone kinase-like protein
LKKLINDVDAVLRQSLQGFGRAHADLVAVDLEPAVIRRKAPTRPGKVALISGGGTGHEPLHGGYVGMGMLDAACPGQVFTSPTPDQMLAAIEATDSGAGALLLVKNYEGDVMNFDMAAEMTPAETARVLINDDVAVENSSFTTGRRGVAGTVVVEKITGAAAEDGMDLAGLEALGNAVNGATRSMGCALTSCTVPAAGGPTFAIGDDEMEMGVGIHGEPGRKRVKLAPASSIVEEMMQAVLGDLAPARGDEVLLLVNGFGATPLMELYLVYHAAVERAETAGLKVARSLVGNWCTSLDMAGCSLTVTRLDAETTRLWDAPVHTPGLRWGC